MDYWIKKLIKGNTLNKFGIIFIIIFTACKSVELNSTDFVLSKDTYQKLLSKKVNNHRKIIFDASISSNGKKSQQIGGVIALFDDSTAFIKLRSKTWGIEIARLYITVDSIVLINRLRKEVLTNTQIPKQFRDFCKVETINYLFGRKLASFENCKTKFIDKNKIQQLCNDFSYEIELKNKNISYQKYLNNQLNLELDYEDVSKIARKIKIHARINKTHYEGKIYNIDILKNKDKNIDIVIPKNY